jgi:hypothetical protein
VEAIGPNRKFGDMGHPSRGTERYRILDFNLETRTAGRLTIQTVAWDDRARVAESVVAVDEVAIRPL